MRRVGSDAIPALAALCGRAFIDNPLFVAVFPDLQTRRLALPHLFSVSLSHGVQAGEVWADDDSLQAAAVWLPSTALRPTPWQALRAGGVQLFTHVSPRALQLLSRSDDDVHRVHLQVASRAHAYLSLIVVEPGCQGRGRGAALLGAGLAEVDRQGLPAYLETAVPGHVARFERAGFVEKKRYAAGPLGVEHVAMLRPGLGSPG